MIVAARPEPPLVVFAGALAVVRDLLGEDGGIGGVRAHWATLRVRASVLIARGGRLMAWIVTHGDPVVSREVTIRAMQRTANAGSSLRWFTAFLVDRRGGGRHRDLRARRAQPRARRLGATGRRHPPRRQRAGPEGSIDAPAARSDRGTARHRQRVGARSAGVRAVEIRIDGTGVSGAHRHRTARRRQGQARGAEQREQRLRVSRATSSRMPAPSGADRRDAFGRRDRQRRPRARARHALLPRPGNALHAGARSRARTRRRSICCPRFRASTSAARPSSTRCMRLIVSTLDARGLSRSHPLPAHDQGRCRRLRLRSRLGSEAQVRRAAHRRRFAQRACSPMRRPSGCRCSSR